MTMPPPGHADAVRRLEEKVDELLESNALILKTIRDLEPGVKNMDGHVNWVESVLNAAYQQPMWALSQATGLLGFGNIRSREDDR